MHDPIALIALDLDRTLFRSDTTVSDRTLGAIDAGRPAPAPPRRVPSACGAPSQAERGAAPLSLGLARRLRMGEGSAAGGRWGDSRGTGDVGRLEGADCNGMATAPRGETSRRGAHVAPESRRDCRGLGDPIARCVASTSRGKRWRVGCARQMTENRADHLGLSDGGEHPQRPLMAQRKVARLPPPTQWRKTGGQIQGKPPLQEPRPTPARRRCCGLIPLHALWTRRRRDRAAQAAMRRHTAPIPPQMDTRQRYQRRQLLQQFQRRECDAGRSVRPGFRKAIDELAIGSFFKTLQRSFNGEVINLRNLRMGAIEKWDRSPFFKNRNVT